MDAITIPVVTAFDRDVAIDSFIFGADLFDVFDPDPGHFVANFQIQDFGVDGGFFSLNGLALEAGIFHVLTPAEIVQLQYNGDNEESFETFGVRVTDSAGNLSGTAFGVITTVLADSFNAPTVVAFDSQVGVNGSIPALQMFAVSDPDEDFFVSQFEFIDTVDGGGQFFLNGQALEAGVFHAITPEEINGLTYVGGAEVSAENFGIRVTDSAGNLSNTDFATVSTLFADFFTSPTITALPTSAPANTAISLLDKVRVEDPDFGASVATFQVRDDGAGAGSFFLNDVELAPNVFHDIASFQLSSFEYRTTDTFARETFTVRAIDGGGNISNTSTSIITSANSSSVVTATDGRVLPLETVPLSNFFSVTDIDGDTPVSIGILDRNNNIGGGVFEVRGETLPQAQFAFFPFNELDDILYRGADGGESEDISVIVFDGSSFSEEVTFTITTSSVPVITATGQTVLENEVRLASDFITFSDVDGDTAVAYNIIDRRINADGGFFQLDGVRLPSGQFFNVTAQEFERLQYVGAANGPDTENIAFHVFDSGGQWSALTDVTVNTVTLAEAVVTDFSIQRGQFVNIGTGGVSNVSGAQAEGTPFVTFADPDGDPVDQLLFVDRQLNQNGGHFLLNGVRLPSATFFSVTPAQLFDLEYRGGTFGPQTEDLSVIPFSNGQAGQQVDFQIFTLPNLFAPEVNFNNASSPLGTSIPISQLFTTSDQDGDLPTTFSFFDTGDSPDSGFFSDNGVVLTPREFQTFSFDEIENIQYTFGSTGGSEVVRLFVNDGRSSSELQSATFTSVATPEIAILDNAIQVDTFELVPVSSLFNQTDSGPAFTQFQVLDENADELSGRFVINGVDLQQGVIQTLSAAEFANLQFQGAETDFGRSLDSILIRSTNGVTGFSDFERINITTDPVGAEALDSGFQLLDPLNVANIGRTVITYTFIDGNAPGNGQGISGNFPPLPLYFEEICGDDPNAICDDDGGEVIGLNFAQRDSIRDAFDGIEGLANLEFVEVAFSENADNAAIVFGAADLNNGDSTVFPPTLFDDDGNQFSAPVGLAEGSIVGDIFFNTENGFNPLNNFDTQPGSEFRLEAIESILLALGLSQPEGFPALPNSLDLNFNTILSNNSDSVFNPSDTGEFPVNPSTPQLFDIVALQELYGVNTTFNDGDNEYGNFFSGSELHFVDNQTSLQTTLFDAGGNDTYNFTNHIANETIDLRQGTFSTINGVPQSLRTAYGSVIENARGGSGNDTLRGNEIANFLIANDGNDILQGGGGNDVLRGQAGDDTFIWTLGDGRDLIQEESGGGTDLLEIRDPSGMLDSLEDDLTFRRFGNDLRIDLTFDQMPGQGTVTIQDFADPNSSVEVLRLIDSTGNQIGSDIDLANIFEQATTVSTRFEATGFTNNIGTFIASEASPV